MAIQPQVIATYNDPRPSREGLVAEQILLPTGKAAEDFAIELIEAEGLKPWNPNDGTTSGYGEQLSWKARHSADGKEVVVYFVTGKDAKASGKVCRIRRSQGGASEAHWQAIQWCSLSFGIEPL